VINFRYHLVSIVAVFLALAIGLFIGATELRPTTEKRLDTLSAQEKAYISTLHTQISQLQSQIGSDTAFAQSAAPRLLTHLLAGQTVLLLAAPGSDQAVLGGLTTAIGQAGGRVTGQVALQPQFFATTASSERSLTALARQLAPPGLVLADRAGAGQAGAGQQQAAQVIAAALMAKSPADPLAASARTILSSFSSRGYLSVSPANGAQAMSPATLAVVVIPATPPARGDTDPLNMGLIAVAQRLDAAGDGTLLAGTYPGSGTGSAIDAVTSGAAGVQLSTVDNANTEIGQIVTVWALALLRAGDKPTAWGAIPGTAPSPAPTPSPTPSIVGPVQPPNTTTGHGPAR
jgi:hypothetical protein